MSLQINYLGKKVNYRFTVDNIDEAQALLDLYKKQGKTACATHKNNQHQIYTN